MTIFRPHIALSFPSTVWRLQIDGQTDLLGIELRNEADKQTSFASLNLVTGQMYFTDLTLPERWLTGIEGIYQGIMLLHYYKQETGPEHKAIIAIDTATGAERWSNYSLALDHLAAAGPVVYNTNMLPKKLMLADILTGQTLRPFDAATDKPLENNIRTPAMLTAGELPPGILPDEPYGNMVHYLNHNNYIIVSLHTLKNGALQQHLYIINNNEVIYHDLLNQDIQKLQPEAFVLHKNILVYIKNKAEIKALKL
ncbi:DUF4905 domain-containing protein [Mucilaginibacter phyllosphaerae]|uniref:DUF4905 domain-containing protein n=1 Tax=Mucilaginibacter phyllosphaerae TaxID=1812349 RepID=A0A4Y8A9I4_9SPHI|nr:DUF4905 domain-containing protein [Mucilaginibacter phyllosphaerae]MBB3970475.1 hypothetical protein [Mucilaginibacter phyllosphaerae]TEW64491.1 DUF4905 domain-containing protein [Mucilaginibacter phyllosphaerae]GGH19018.1 hypothetical protein GCM10007352_30110 [Mucilaginibacter phyllosphaerae]